MSLTAEIQEIAARRPDAIRSPLGQQAAAHHRLAAFITENDLPDASVSISNHGRAVTIGATHTDLPENVVRRWAQALEAVVVERPAELDGTAATLLLASTTIDGTWYQVSAFLPIEATA